MHRSLLVCAGILLLASVTLSCHRGVYQHAQSTQDRPQNPTDVNQSPTSTQQPPNGGTGGTGTGNLVDEDEEEHIVLFRQRRDDRIHHDEIKRKHILDSAGEGRYTAEKRVALQGGHEVGAEIRSKIEVKAQSTGYHGKKTDIKAVGAAGAGVDTSVNHDGSTKANGEAGAGVGTLGNRGGSTKADGSSGGISEHKLGSTDKEGAAKGGTAHEVIKAGKAGKAGKTANGKGTSYEADKIKLHVAVGGAGAEAGVGTGSKGSGKDNTQAGKEDKSKIYVKAGSVFKSQKSTNLGKSGEAEMEDSHGKDTGVNAVKSSNESESYGTANKVGSFGDGKTVSSRQKLALGNKGPVVGKNPHGAGAGSSADKIAKENDIHEANVKNQWRASGGLRAAGDINASAKDKEDEKKVETKKEGNVRLAFGLKVHKFEGNKASSHSSHGKNGGNAVENGNSNAAK